MFATFTFKIFAFLMISSLFLRDTCFAITHEYFLFCINKTSNSPTFLTRKVLKPSFWKFRVFRADPYPILGIAICPLNRLRTRLSIPLGFLQLSYKISFLNYSQFVVSVSLVTRKLFCVLLDNLEFLQRLWHFGLEKVQRRKK